jgi:Concanavalin A-like lectin/glucanases superfamily
VSPPGSSKSSAAACWNCGLLPTNTWSHLAVTLSGNTGTLYVNGTPVGTKSNITLRPSSLGATTQNWIGRSQYSDPTLNGAVDDFQIYSRALTTTEVQALAGGQQSAGDVASYRFDEASAALALDSSGNGRDATIVSPTASNTCPGKVFLQRDLQSGSLVCWKDQQNFAPFIDRVAPNDDNYKQALRYYADRAEFPIMPFYTAIQADKAAAFGRPGSNNFSNINATLQARLFSTAIRHYPSDNARMVDSFSKAGVDVSATGGATNLARGKAASASFTTTSPVSQATDPANAVDGFAISGLPVTQGAYVGTNPIWGDLGSPNAQDWYQVDFGAPTRLNGLKLYFYSNKAFGSGATPTGSRPPTRCRSTTGRAGSTSLDR